MFRVRSAVALLLPWPNKMGMFRETFGDGQAMAMAPAAETDQTTARDKKSLWIARILGIDVGRGQGGGDPAVSVEEAIDGFRDAMDAVDEQIDDLQRALLASGDEELQSIAQFGLSAVTGNFKVPLLAALQEAGSGPVTSQVARKVSAAAEAFRAHLDRDRRVAACDRNPYGVTMSIRATLAPALAQLKAAFAAVAGD